MGSRLEKAISQLPPDAIEKLADYAELLAKRSSGTSRGAEFLKLDWVGGAAAAYPEHSSGVEAAHAAGEMIRQTLERPRTP